MNAEKLMQSAIDVCRRGIAAGQSPFGAAIADREGELIAAAHNTVRLTCDPTAHAEVNAIRKAAETLGKIDLTGHVMATTCEPCPMCAAAIHWARLEVVYFGASIADADEAGFNEMPVSCEHLYERGRSSVQVERGVLRDACRSLFIEWQNGPKPDPY